MVEEENPSYYWQIPVLFRRRSRIYKWLVVEPSIAMSDELSCHVCGWTGSEDELNRPPGGEEKYYCPECATTIEIE